MTSATPKLIVRYKASTSRNVLFLMAALAPIWAIWVPYVMGWLFMAVIQGGLVDFYDLFFLGLYFLGLFAVSLFTIAVCWQNKLVIGASGIQAPVRFIIQTLGARNFAWSRLRTIRFQTGNQINHTPEEMCFEFDHGTLPLKFEGLTPEDIQNIFLAVEAYAPHTVMVPSPKELKGLPQISSSPGLSFTQMWDQELKSRFGSTIFIPLEPGTKMQDGRIEIVGQIAFGGLSAIYLAKTDERLVVVKEAVIPANADEASKAKALEMFEREAQFLVSLDHPRIAKVYDHFVENGRNYLLLEYIEGKDLRTFVKESGALPEAMALRWGKEIADILTYLHGLEPPIVHRDLTPDNIVLEKDGSITLIDFGAANAFMGTATGTLVGKQSYISPEQFRGKANPASDIYSLGCTLHYLLTAQDPEPLSTSSPAEALAEVAATAGSSSSGNKISAPTNELVMALTQMEVEDRLGPAKVVATKIQELLAAPAKRS